MKILDKLILQNDKLVKIIIELIQNRTKSVVTYFNVHCFYVYSKNNEYKKLLDDQLLVYPDGTGIWFLLNKVGRLYFRFNATDINYQLLDYCAETKLNLIFIGGNYNEDFIHHKSRAYGLNLIKYINGFLDNKVIIDEVSKLNADVIFIGTGVPKQELLAIEISKNVNDLVIICVGNFFNFYFNFQKRAPSFFRKLGLEWLYRLSLEPKRLWKRYTIENLFFIKEYLIAKKK